MLKKSLLAVLVGALPFTASAHEIWLEREGTGTVRAYVGDVTGERDKGEDIAKLVKTTRLFAADPAKTVPVTAHPDHLAAEIDGAGDIRLFNDQVWEPWKGEDGTYEAAAFQAKEGRTETKAVFDLELVPVAADSDSFTLTFKGEPLADTRVTVVNPELWEKSFKTDAEGRIAVPVKDKGRYVLIARHEVPSDVEIAGKKVARLQHIASVSFVAE